MGMFKNKARKDTAKKQDGKKFLADAKDQHAELFLGYAERGEEDYDDVASLMSDVQNDAWELTEALLKKSYYNGLQSGARRSK